MNDFQVLTGSVALPAAFVVLIPGDARPARASIPCAAPSAQYVLTCFSPSEVSSAEQSFGAHAVNPSRIVYGASRLTLHDVVIGVRALPQPSSRASLILYDYGAVLAGPVSTVAGSGSVAKWVTVTEQKGRVKGLKGVAVYRVGSQSGEWQLQGNFAALRLSLFVENNGSKSTVVFIGCKLLDNKLSAVCRR